MKVNPTTVGEVRHNEERWKQVQHFLKGNSQTDEAKEVLEEVLNSESAFLILLENRGKLKGLVTLTPASNVSLKSGLGKSPWRLRFCAQGEIFEFLKEIAYSDLEQLDQRHLDDYHLGAVVEVLDSIRDSFLGIEAIIVNNQRNDLDKDSCLFLESLQKAARYKGREHRYRRFGSYKAVIF